MKHLVIPIFYRWSATSKVIYQKCQTLPNPPMLKIEIHVSAKAIQVKNYQTDKSHP